MNSWSLVYDEYKPEEERRREALCTLGNGFFCTRGAGEETEASEHHYPGTYLAGGYNRLKSEINGHIIENESLVNLPNWLPLSFRPMDGDWFHPDRVEILEYRQELNFQAGLLERHIRFRDTQKRTTRLVSRRLVHMERPHLAALQIQIEPEDWDGRIQIRTSLNGQIRNAGVQRYRSLSRRHLEPVGSGTLGGDVIYLLVRTNQSRLEAALAARTALFEGDRLADPERRLIEIPDGHVGQILEATLSPDAPVTAEKTAALYTSRDPATAEPVHEACRETGDAPRFDELARTQAQAWEHLWNQFDLRFRDRDEERGERTGRALHLHTFHLLQTANPNTTNMALDVGIPPRGWTGEAYRGHIMWDELFIFPFFNLRVPEISRNIQLYRYRRLDLARRAALGAGRRGAMFPWQSGSNGREESQKIHLNPRSGRWIPDHSDLQYHVNHAIAYNVWNYYQVTRDKEFLRSYGAELIFEIARFLDSLAGFDQERERFVIKGVMGPDEYHEQYPGSEHPGVDNNAYTNVFTVWVFRRALELPHILAGDDYRRLRTKLGLLDNELERWRDMTRRMYVPFHGDGIISQFEGYEKLEEFDWEKYRRKYDNIQRLDRILEAEGDSPNRYKLSKQADVLMLFYLFSTAELKEIFDGLRYPFEGEIIPRNVDYYLERAAHGSTLSWTVHAWVLARRSRDRSWALFDKSLRSDITDIQGGTTEEGIHLGAMAGAVDQVQRGYTGIVTREDTLWFEPCLPEEIEELHLQIRYRGYSLQVEITPEVLRIKALRTKDYPITVGHRGETLEIQDQEMHEFRLKRSE